MNGAANESPAEDLRTLRPAGRLGYTVTPRLVPDATMRATELSSARRHTRGFACRAPSFPPTVISTTIDGEAATVPTWWFEFSPEGFANHHFTRGRFLSTPNSTQTALVTDYREGYVIYRWRERLVYQPWFTEILDVEPVGFSTMRADLRERLGCPKLDLDWIASPPLPYRSYATFGVETPDEAIRRLPPLNTGTLGVVQRPPDFAPTPHPAYGSSAVDAWFFEFDPTVYTWSRGRMAEHQGRRDYRAGYVIFDWGGELRYHTWTTLPNRTSADAFMVGAFRLDIGNRFGCLREWHN